MRMRGLLAIALLSLLATVARAETTALADAPQEEREGVERLRHGDAWVRRAIAAERLARYDCDASGELLSDLATDRSWAVRTYALVALARRGLSAPKELLEREREPRVLRAALRARHPVPTERIAAAAERLAASASLDDKLLALELVLAAPEPPALPRTSEASRPEELLRTIVFRMDRVQAGVLSPRIAAITSGRDSGRSYRWREWYRKNRRELGLHGGHLVPLSVAERSRGAIAALSTQRFLAFERHVADLADRRLELAIVLDCTASMSGELAECQGGIDALMLFALGVARDVRVGVVGYRDRSDAWETKAFDFTNSLDTARERLWQLSAEGGGDSPESVLAGLRLAYERLSWSPPEDPAQPPTVLKRVVLIGDGPPHPGTGDRCVSLAGLARRHGVTTYAIQPRAEAPPKTIPEEKEEEEEADEPPEAAPSDSEDPMRDPRRWDRPGFAPWFGPPRGRDSPWRRKLEKGEVAYFAEIAEAGGGRAVGLARDASLVAEIVGLTLGDRFAPELEHFFAGWQALCR